MLDSGIAQQQRARIMHGAGFIAALDQSGGSTPKALVAYGHALDDWQNDDQMFAAVHRMRCRVMQAPSFAAGGVLGAILFEKTLCDAVDGRPTAWHLWHNCGVVPFLKVDEGLAADQGGVQLMKPMQGLARRLDLANQHGVYGTKMRAVIKSLDPSGIRHVVAQQFDVAKQIMAAGLVPIIEPEVDIFAERRTDIEALLLEELMRELDLLDDRQQVILKLSIPEEAGVYTSLANHARVQRLVALSGGFSCSEACERLSQNSGMIASFSRALLENLNVQQSDAAFDEGLGRSIDAIAKASA